MEKTETLDKKGDPNPKKVPLRTIHPEWDPFGNNATVRNLFWVSICSSATYFPDSGRKEKLGQDGGARPNFLQDEIFHCFVKFFVNSFQLF